MKKLLLMVTLLAQGISVIECSVQNKAAQAVGIPFLVGSCLNNAYSASKLKDINLKNEQFISKKKDKLNAIISESNDSSLDSDQVQAYQSLSNIIQINQEEIAKLSESKKFTSLIGTAVPFIATSIVLNENVKPEWRMSAAILGAVASCAPRIIEVSILDKRDLIYDLMIPINDIDDAKFTKADFINKSFESVNEIIKSYNDQANQSIVSDKEMSAFQEYRNILILLAEKEKKAADDANKKNLSLRCERLGKYGIPGTNILEHFDQRGYKLFNIFQNNIHGYSNESHFLINIKPNTINDENLLEKTLKSLEAKGFEVFRQDNVISIIPSDLLMQKLHSTNARKVFIHTETLEDKKPELVQNQGCVVGKKAKNIRPFSYPKIALNDTKVCKLQEPELSNSNLSIHPETGKIERWSSLKKGSIYTKALEPQKPESLQLVVWHDPNKTILKDTKIVESQKPEPFTNYGFFVDKQSKKLQPLKIASNYSK